MITKNKPNQAVLAVYQTHEGAEACVKEIRRLGFDMKKLSIIGRDYHTEEQVVGYYNTGDRVKYWGSQGAFWGGIWGWLFGSAFLLVPGIGPVIAGGPVVGWLVGALEGAVVGGGMSALGACLYSQGIAKDSVMVYETAIKSGKFVVVAHGTDEEVTQARKIMHRTSAELSDTHQLSGETIEAERELVSA